MIGWTIQAALHLLRISRRRGRQATSHSGSGSGALVQEVLLHSDSLKFALFLSNLVFVYRSSSCVLRRLTGKVAGEDCAIRAVSGFLSGLSMSLFPSTQIALHTFWKTMFNVYFASAYGRSPAGQSLIDLLFVMADSFLINCMVMEPWSVAPSYMRLIDSFTGGCLQRFNVVTMFLLGHRDNSFRYGKRLPDLQAEHVSRTYMETIASWGLEQRDD